MYVYKFETSVFPISITINDTKPCPGSVSDLIIFQSTGTFQKLTTNTSDSEMDIEDDDLLSDEFLELWGVIIDK